MRPNHVLLILNQKEELQGFAVYYNARNCKSAARRFNRVRDGYHRLWGEDGSMKSYNADPNNPLRAEQRWIGEYLWLPEGKSRRTFINATDAEFDDVSETMRLPKAVLKKVAEHEAEFFEDPRIRWEILKRRFWPRFLY
jgi:hypothetical protein